MFEDFDQDSGTREGRRRAGVSMALSVLIFVLTVGGLAAAVATARAVVRTPPREVDVEFATLPPPPAPEVEEPPAPAPAEPRPAPRQRRTRRPAARQRNLRPPSEIPSGQPAEAEGELVEAGDTGPVEGFTDGGDEEVGEAVAATPPAPAPEPAPPPREPRQRRESIRPPRFVGGCRAPEIPDALHAQAATIRVEVRMLIGPDGRVLDARVVRGHPLVPDDAVLRCAREQQFEPAELSDGTRVPHPFRRRFVFRPARA